MTGKGFEPGRQASLSVEYNGRRDDFSTEVVSVDKDSVYLAPVYIGGKTVGFRGCGVRLLYAADGKAYEWSLAELPAVTLPGRGMCYRADILSDGTEINRRGAFRVHFGEYMDVVCVIDGTPVKCNVLVRDISETGFGFISKNEYKKGQQVKLKITTGEGTLVLGARVVRKVPPDGPNGTAQYGCAFSKQDARLGQYLAKVQREKKQQRKGA